MIWEDAFGTHVQGVTRGFMGKGALVVDVSMADDGRKESFLFTLSKACN